MADENPFNQNPWGPHGARQDRPGPPAHPADSQIPTPIIPPSPYTPVPSPTPTYSGGQGMPVNQVLPFLRDVASRDFLLNLIFVGFLWEAWVCLYPLSALAGLFTLVYAMPFLRGVLPESPIIGPGLCAVVLAIGAGAVVLWKVSRLEHDLARHKLYRILRHLVRLPLLGIAAVVALERARGLPYNPTPAEVMQILMVPANLATALGVMIVSHFILWNWKRGREFWHRRLVSARLRKRTT